MNYYIKSDTLQISKLPYLMDLDKYQGYQKLTLGQYNFAVANPQANLTEILAKALTPKTAEQLFSEAKQVKTNELNTWLGGELAKGFLHKGNTYDLTISKKDNIADQFTGFQMDLANGILEVNLSLAYITDRKSVQQSFNWADFKIFSKNYKDLYLFVFGTYSVKRNAITKAVSIADLDLIII